MGVGQSAKKDKNCENQGVWGRFLDIRRVSWGFLWWGCSLSRESRLIIFDLGGDYDGNLGK